MNTPDYSQVWFPDVYSMSADDAEVALRQNFPRTEQSVKDANPGAKADIMCRLGDGYSVITGEIPASNRKWRQFYLVITEPDGRYSMIPIMLKQPV